MHLTPTDRKLAEDTSSPERIEPKPAARDRSTGKTDEQQLRDSLAELSAIYEAAPVAMMIVDRERRVRKVNGFAAVFAGRPAEEMIGMRGGEALRCLHHLDNPEGCGFGPYCRRCRIRKAVVDTFSAGKNFQNIEQWLPFPRGESEEERCLQISTALLKTGDADKVLVCAQDITDRKHVERKLLESEQRFRLALRNAPVSVAVQDRDLKYVWAYPPATVPSENFIGRLDEEVFAPGEAARITAFKRRVLEENVEMRRQMWFHRPNGRAFLDITWAPIRDGNGRVTGVASASVDLTPIKLVEEEQKKNRARLELMAKVAEKLLRTEDPKSTVGEICRLVMAHIDCQFFFNYLLETPAGGMHLNTAAGISKEFAAAMHRLEFNAAGGEGAAREGRRVIAENIQSSDDQRTERVRSFGVQAYCCHPLMAQNRLIGTLSFGTKTRPTFSTDEVSLMKSISDQLSVAMQRQLSERELIQFNETLELQVAERTAELEETVRELKREADERRTAEVQLEKLSKVFMDSTDPIIIENMQHRITDMNRAAEKIYGYTRDELIGESVTHLVPEKERATALDRRRRCIEEGTIHNWEGFRQDRTGNTYPALITAFELRGPDGLSESIVTIAKDISAIKELQKEIQQRASQLAKLTSELTLAEQRERHRLARTLHDNLQQLLAGVKLKLEILAADTPLTDHPELVSARDLIIESLQTSRSLATELSPPVLFQQGLPNALKWLAKHMERTHHLSVEVHAEDHADPEQEEIKILLFESVRELLFNVVKHTDKKSAAVELSCDAQWVNITVRDDGPGFSPEKLSEKDSEDSGGLGLFHIRERLQLLGGRFAIESSNGRGTTVTLTSPLRSSTYAEPESETVQPEPSIPAPPASVEPRPSSEGKIRVMLVDDHAVMRNGLSAMLSRDQQISVVGEASSGEEAVRMARKLHPDVVLMDVNMPGMNGIAATRIISTELRNVGIIGLSMHEADDQAELMRRAGAVAYQQKTGSSKDLLNAIYRAVNRASAG